MCLEILPRGQLTNAKWVLEYPGRVGLAISLGVRGKSTSSSSACAHVCLRRGTVPGSAAQGQTSHLAFEGWGSRVKFSLVVTMRILLSAAAPAGRSSRPAPWAVLPLGPSCCRTHGCGGSIRARHTAQHWGPHCWLLIAELIRLWVLVSVSAGLHLAPCKVCGGSVCRGTAALPDFQLHPLGLWNRRSAQLQSGKVNLSVARSGGQLRQRPRYGGCKSSGLVLACVWSTQKMRRGKFLSISSCLCRHEFRKARSFSKKLQFLLSGYPQAEHL